MELVGPRQRNGHRIGIFVFLVLLDLVFIIVSIKMIIKVVINKQIKSFKFAGKT